MPPPSRTPTADELLRHSEWLGALARRLVRDGASAEDLVQETWLAALRRGPELGEDLRPWLARVVRNAARQRARSERARHERERAATSEPADWPSSGELVSRLEIRRELIDAVLALDEPLRSTVILHFFEGRSSAQIARAAGVPQSTVRWRVQRALELLRGELDARHGDERRAWLALALPLARRAPAPSASWMRTIVMTSSMKVALSGLAAVVVACALWLALSPKDAARELSTRTAIPSADGGLSAPALEPAAEPRAREELAKAPATDTRALLVATIVEAGGRALANAHLAAQAWSPAASAVSDEQGRVELALRDVPAEPTWVELRAFASGHVEQRLGLRVERGRTIPLGEIVLPSGASVHGIVRGDDGRPRADVDVLVEVLDGERRGFFGAIPGYAAFGSIVPHRAHASVPRARTGADGRYWIDGVAPRFVRVWAFDPHFLAAWSPTLDASARRSIDVPDLSLARFDTAMSISGRVLDPDGQPLDAAHVREEATDPRSGQWEEARTASDGAFFFEPKSSQPTVLVAEDAQDRYRPARIENVAAGAQGLELRLAPWRDIELVVRERDGRPLEFFGVSTLTAQPRTDIDCWNPEVHADGRFSIHAATQPFRIVVHSPGHAHSYVGPFEPDTAPATLEVVLERARSFDGVVHRRGRPVAGARVALQIQLDEPYTQRIDEVAARPAPLLARTMGTNSLEATVTDEEGRFVLGVWEGRTWLLRVAAPGCAPLLRWDVHEPASGLVIELDDGGSIEGEVRATGSAPSRSLAGILVGASAGDGHVLYRRCDEDGRFRFEHATPGPWQVRMLERERTPQEDATTHMSYENHGPLHADCQVKSGETARVVLDLAALARPTLTGRMRVDGANPGAWGVVLSEPGTGVRAESVLAPDGSFALEMEKAGRFDLDLHLDGWSHPGANALRVHDVVELPETGSSWSLDFATTWASGSVELAEQERGSSVRMPALVRLDLGGDRAVFATLAPPGARWRVPVGHVQVGTLLQGREWLSFGSRTLDFRAGVEATIDLR